MKIIEIYDLPKISLNAWYSGMHWSKRVAIKNVYHLMIKPLAKRYEFIQVSYFFEFKNNPLDASNCVAMIKMIEDVLFSKRDGFNQIRIGAVESIKAKRDKVTIKIKEISKP